MTKKQRLEVKLHELNEKLDALAISGDTVAYKEAWEKMLEVTAKRDQL